MFNDHDVSHDVGEGVVRTPGTCLHELVSCMCDDTTWDLMSVVYLIERQGSSGVT